MKLQVQTLWVDALLSGVFEQGVGTLRNCNGLQHCCLGVLCEIYKEETGKGHFTFTGNDYLVGDERYMTGLIPEPVLKWAGCTADDAETLAGMNDGGTSFKQIAKYIARKL